MTEPAESRLEQLETRIPPPVWFLLSAALMWVLATATGERVLGDGGDTAATILFFGGVIFGGLGIITVLRARTTIDPHDVSKTSELVTGGVYRLSRNPMYFGLLLILFGWARSLGSVIALIVGTVFFMSVVTRLQIIPEERALEQKFGSDYVEYSDTTRRWI